METAESKGEAIRMPVLLGAHIPLPPFSFQLRLHPPALPLLWRPAASRGLARALQPLRERPRSRRKRRNRGEAALSVVPPPAAPGSCCCCCCCCWGGSGSGGRSNGATVLFPPREEPLNRHELFQGAQHGRARRDVRGLRPGQEGQGLLHAGAGRGGRCGVATGRRARGRGRRLIFF